MFVFCLEKSVKSKKILRFYFGADTLETAEKLCLIIGEKIRLERLWGYLDGVLSVFTDEERGILKKYSSKFFSPTSSTERKAVKRTVIKFTRRARRIGDFAGDFTLLKKYYCLIKV